MDEQKIKPEDTTENQQYIGLGGWLVLVGLGLVGNIFLTLYYIFTFYFPIFTNGMWELLASPSSEYYVPWAGILLIIEMIFQIFIIVACIYLLFLFSKERRQFPKYFIILLIVVLCFGVIDLLLVGSIGLEVSDDSFTDLARGAIYAAIWIPYMLKSKRVKATFVN